MLLALTVERYVSVCHPGQHTRPLCGPPHLTVVLIPLATFLVYLPSVFRGEITTCLLAPGGSLIYQKRDNQSFLNSLYYQVIPPGALPFSRAPGTCLEAGPTRQTFRGTLRSHSL